MNNHAIKKKIKMFLSLSFAFLFVFQFVTTSSNLNYTIPAGENNISVYSDNTENETRN